MFREYTSDDLVTLNLLRFILWLRISSSLENIQCVPEKNIYSTIIGYRVLLIFIASTLLIVPFTSSKSFPILVSLFKLLKEECWNL